MLGTLLAMVWVTNSKWAWLLAGYTGRGLVGLQGTSAGGVLVAALLNRYVLCSAWCYLQFANVMRICLGAAPRRAYACYRHTVRMKSNPLVLLCIAPSGSDLV